MKGGRGNPRVRNRAKRFRKQDRGTANASEDKGRGRPLSRGDRWKTSGDASATGQQADTRERGGGEGRGLGDVHAVEVRGVGASPVVNGLKQRRRCECRHGGKSGPAPARVQQTSLHRPWYTFNYRISKDSRPRFRFGHAFETLRRPRTANGPGRGAATGITFPLNRPAMASECLMSRRIVLW